MSWTPIRFSVSNFQILNLSLDLNKKGFFETNTLFRDHFKRLSSNKKCKKSNIVLGFFASEGRRGLCGTYWVALDPDLGKTRLDSVWLSFHPSSSIQHSWWLVAGRHLNSRIQVEQRRGRRFLQKVGEHRDQARRHVKARVTAGSFRARGHPCVYNTLRILSKYLLRSRIPKLWFFWRTSEHIG